MIDFTYLEGRDCELLVKELAVVDSHSNRFSSYVFKRPYDLEEVPMFNVRTNQAITHGCNWNGGDIPYSELETVLHRDASPVFAIHSFRPQNTEFISGFIDLQLLISLS